jgi:uncharacterized protein YsxB (DUF464 family)
LICSINNLKIGFLNWAIYMKKIKKVIEIKNLYLTVILTDLDAAL